MHGKRRLEHSHTELHHHGDPEWRALDRRHSTCPSGGDGTDRGARRLLGHGERCRGQLRSQRNLRPVSGSIFQLGSTTIECSATDSGGTTGFGSAVVNVIDSTDPVVTVPASMTVQPTSSAGATVTFAVTASDLVDPSPDVTCDHSPGLYGIGLTQVFLPRARRVRKRLRRCRLFHLRPGPRRARWSRCPRAGPVEANGPNGAIVNFATPTATEHRWAVAGNVHEGVRLALPARHHHGDLLGDGQRRPYRQRRVHDRRGGHDAAGAHGAGRPGYPVELRRPGEQLGDPGLPRGRDRYRHRRQQRRDHPQRTGHLPPRDDHGRLHRRGRRGEQHAEERRRDDHDPARRAPRLRRTRRLRTTCGGSRRSRATCPWRSPGARRARTTSTT